MATPVALRASSATLPPTLQSTDELQVGNLGLTLGEVESLLLPAGDPSPLLHKLFFENGWSLEKLLKGQESQIVYLSSER